MKKYDNLRFMKLKKISPADVQEKIVLVRVDYNVPLHTDESGNLVVSNDERIQASLETIHFLQENNAKIVLMSHFGRPKSKDDSQFSLAPVAKYMKETLELPVSFSEEVFGEKVQDQIKNLANSEILLLENLRFDAGEKSNDSEFAQKLANLADIYINEAFSTSHRSHASIVGVPNYLPSFGGFALEKEVATFSEMMSEPKRPLVIILGGAKISDKVGAIKHLTNIGDIVLVGGAVANSFLKAEGLEVYKSFIEDAPADLKKQDIDYTDVAKSLVEEHRKEKMLMDGYIPLPKIVYPIDVVAAKRLEVENETETEIIDLTKENGFHDSDLLYLDIGPKTIKLYQEIISHAATIFWNGPMGVWENEYLETGSKKIAASVALATGESIIGGGDTIAAVTHFGLEKQYSYVSAAGGAALDFLSGRELPGLQVLQKE